MEDLSETQLPALNTVLFGSFQVLDVQLSGADDRGVDAPQSYIDFGSGNPAGGFAGVHRFVITRTKNTSEAARVEIHFESMACNPTVDKPFAPLFVHRLHNLYADLLFRDAIFHVEQGLKQ